MEWKTIEEKKIELESLIMLQKSLKEQIKELKAQRTENFNVTLEKLIFNKQTLLKEISKRKHTLNIAIQTQTERQSKGRKTNKNSAVYQKYGKTLKELTKEEYNLYQSRTERKQRKLNKGAG